MFETNPLDKQLEAMRAGVDYRQTISLRNFSMTVRPLTDAEVNEVISTVISEMRKIPEGLRNPTREHTIYAKETMKLASTSDVGKHDPQLTDPLMAEMTTDELLHLYKQYTLLMDRINPSLEKMTKKEIEDLVEDLKKNEPQELASRLTVLSFLQLTSLVQYFVTKND